MAAPETVAVVAAIVSDTTLAAQVAQWFGAAMIFAMVFILWRAHRNRDSNIDLSSLIVDAEEKRVTFSRFGALLALLTSTWLVVYLAVDKALTDLTFAAYVGAWGAVKVAGDITGRPDPGSSSETTTTKIRGAPVAPANQANPLPVAIVAKRPIPVREARRRRARKKPARKGKR